MTIKSWILIGLVFTAQPVFAMGDLMMLQGSLEGKAAPNFTLYKTDGNKTSLNEARAGKKSIIVLWATWCPHCRRQIQILTQRAEEIKSKNIEIILVDIGEDKPKVVDYIKSNKIPWDSFLDTEEEIANQYRVQGVPTLYFVAEDGKVKAVRHDLPGKLEF